MSLEYLGTSRRDWIAYEPETRKLEIYVRGQGIELLGEEVDVLRRFLIGEANREDYLRARPGVELAEGGET